MTRFGEIAFIDDCGAKIGVVEGADSNKTLCNIGRDIEITKSLGMVSEFSVAGRSLTGQGLEGVKDL